MKTAVWWIGALALSVSLWGCAGGDGGGGDAQPQPECVDDDGCEDGQVCVEEVCVDDEVNNEPNNDVNNEMDAGNNAPDMGDGEDEEEPDELIETGEPCDEDDDCQGGTCVQLDDGRKICTEFCSDDSCPEGFDCTFVENSGADAVFLCFPAVDFLCVPCAVDANCGGRSDRCLSYNNGSFCGSTCSNDTPCPEDYDCVATDVEGEEQPVLQCVRSDGFCCMQTNGGVEICDGIDNDCNGRVDDGFEDSNDVENCGACGQVCELPGAAVECVSGECLLTECEADAYNLDGDDSNGCEYECVFIGELDLPDPTFRDDNCDGTDGNVDAAVFVAPAPIGSPEGTGTLEDPVSTLALGIELARQDPDRGYLIVAEGIYNETVELADGISIFGGYRVGEHRWERLSVQEAPTVVGAGRVGMTARNILLPTVVSNLQIQSDGAAMSGTSSYGLRVINASDALVIRGNVIAAGNGANGVDGQTGADGQPGGRGGDGEGGCDGCEGRGSAGSAGASVCGNPGGAGGRGAHGDRRGDSGANGVGPSAGTGGGGGNGDGDSCVFGCDGGGNGSGGGVGGGGGPGGNGGPGDANGGRDGDDWLGGSGQPGAAGVNGSGGGGGGGGGGSSCCRNDRGGGGGGGGGGGCGGDGGTGGQGGGASIGVLLIDASPLLQNNVITSAIGGAGGAGAVGGTGGGGGAFGAAGGPADDGGPGGVGGAGGAGGNGGCGGGGAGGPSIGVLVGPGSVPSLMANEVTPGMGGPGGGSCGNAGPDGTVAEQL